MPAFPYAEALKRTAAGSGRRIIGALLLAAQQKEFAMTTEKPTLYLGKMYAKNVILLYEKLTRKQAIPEEKAKVMAPLGPKIPATPTGSSPPQK